MSLTDDSPCPVKGKHKGVSMKDVSAAYLLWCCDQDWCSWKYPDLTKYVERNRDLLEREVDEKMNKLSSNQMWGG